MGLISERDPVVITTVITDLNNNNVNQYRAIFCRKIVNILFLDMYIYFYIPQGSQKLCIPYNSNSPMTIKKILRYDYYYCIYRCILNI